MRRLTQTELLLLGEKILGLDQCVKRHYFDFDQECQDMDHHFNHKGPTTHPLTEPAHGIKITIGEQDRLKIHEFVRAAMPSEVYIKTLVERNKNHFHLSKPIFLKQKCNSYVTILDLTDEDKYIRELLASGRPFEEIQKELLSIKCWFHSHHRDSPCWWSNVDERNCQRFDNGDYFISVVVKPGWKGMLYYRCRLDFFEPKKEVREMLEQTGFCHVWRMTLTNLEIRVIDDRPADFDPNSTTKKMKKLAQKKVRPLRPGRGENEVDEERIESFQKIRESRISPLAADPPREASGNNRGRSGGFINRVRAGFSWLRKHYDL